MQPTTKITTIIPTVASANRSEVLRRAVDSIRGSSNQSIAIIAVVNGNRSDPDVCRWLRSQDDIRYEQVPTPSAPLAVLRGRELVETPYFSVLDDDDEYLPGGMDARLALLSCHPNVDLLITSGIRRIGEVDHPIMTAIERVPSVPLQSLFSANWLGSCNGLYRSSSFPPQFFANPHPFLEWTWIAFKLALAGKELMVYAQPTFRIHDSPGSVSKSQAYNDAQQTLYRRMLNAGPPADIARIIKLRMRSDWHDQSVRALGQGRRLSAMLFHLRSLLPPGGLRYLSYTRRLIPGWPDRQSAVDR